MAADRFLKPEVVLSQAQLFTYNPAQGILNKTQSILST